MEKMQRHQPRVQFEMALHDLRAGLRGIRKSPVFSLVVILTMALGIGVNTAVFSVVHAILLQPPPYPHGERLTEIWEATSGQRIPVSWINFQHWRHENHTFEEMAGYDTANLVLTGRGDATLKHGGVVSSSFFRLTGWQPLTGRLFQETDDRPGAAPTVLLSSEFWARSLNNDPHAVGTTLTLDGTAYQIIGILPPGQRFSTQPIDFYLTAGLRGGNTVNRAEHGSMTVLGLLKPGVTTTVANSDLDGIMRRLAASDPGLENNHRSSISWLSESGTNEIRPMLITLTATVGLVLIISCVNVAGLLLLRGTSRTREIAIRAAIGATRDRLARQLLTENLVVVALGGVAGLQFAAICLRFLLLLAPQDIPRLEESTINWAVLWFTAVITIVTGLLAGLAPVFAFRGLDIPLALKEGTPGAGSGERGQSLRSGLMIAEIALTLVLAFGCGLLVRSLIAAQRIYPGFSADQVLAVEVLLPPSRYKTDDAASQFYRLLLQQLRSLPGVESVGAIDCPPSTGGCAKGWYSIKEMPAPVPADVPLTLLTKVDQDYFRTLRIPLLAGRGFTAADHEDWRAVVVNEKLARHWWPNMPQLAVGQRIKFGGPYVEGPVSEIVGVIGNVSQEALDIEAFPEIYVRGVQNGMFVMVRTTGDPTALIPAVRRQLVSLDRNVPVVSLVPLRRRMEATLERRRFSTLLIGVFSALAVTLTSVGIYGMLNYWVRTRQKEIAIRMALGARRSDILQWTGWHVMRIAGLGVVLGAFGCWGISQLLRGMVFGISAQNPLMLLAASVSVIAMAALAACIPIWRATRVDPVRDLHSA
jgi:predicted permease